MPTRPSKSCAYVLMFALGSSAFLPSLALAQRQSSPQTPSGRTRRPSTTPAKDELDRINEARIREMDGLEEPLPRETARETAREPVRATGTYVVLKENRNSSANTLPEGTVIVTEMLTKLSSKTAQAGDRLRAKVITPVTVNRTVLIPAGSLIEGQVQDVVRAKSRRRSGMIEISFDRLRIGKDVYPIEATLAPVAAGDDKRLDSDRRLTRSSGGVKRTAAFVGGGVGAGAAIGYVAGSALFGAGIGAGVGVAALLLAKGKEAEVATGMQIGAELLTPITLNQVAVDNADAQLDSPDAYDRTRRQPAATTDFVYDRNEVKSRNNAGVSVPPVKTTPRVPVVTPGKASGKTPVKTVNAGGSTVSALPAGGNSSNPINRADRQAVNVTNLLAERGSDDTIRVSITGQTPTAGWKLVPESTIENGELKIKLFGAPPQSLAAQVISSATTLIIESDPNRTIQRVSVRGATNFRTTVPISRDTRNTGGNSTVPTSNSAASSGNPNREDLSALGMRVADKSDALVEDYARSLRAWKTNNKYNFETPRDEGTPEAQLLYAFDRLSEAAAVFRSPLNTEAKRRAVRDLINTHAQVNRLWALVKVSAEFKQRWQDIHNDSNQLSASVPGATAPRTINPNQPRPRG